MVKRSLLNLAFEESLVIKLTGFMRHCFDIDNTTTKAPERNKTIHINVTTLIFRKYAGDRLASKTELKIGMMNKVTIIDNA